MTPAPPLTCRELVELVTDYLEGALPEARRVQFEAHIDCCGWCTRYLVQMRETHELVGHIDPEGLDPRVEATMLDAFREWRTGGGA